MSLRRADVHGNGRPNSKAKLPEQETSLTISQPDSMKSEGVRKTKRQMVSSLFSRLKGSGTRSRRGSRDQVPGFNQEERCAASRSPSSTKGHSDSQPLCNIPELSDSSDQRVLANFEPTPNATFQPLDLSAWGLDLRRIRGRRRTFPDGQAVKGSPAYDLSNVQPLRSSPPPPTLSHSAGWNEESTAPSGQISPANSIMSAYTHRLDKLRLEELLDSSADQPRIAPPLVTRAQNDGSRRDSLDDEPLCSTSTTSLRGQHVQIARSQKIGNRGSWDNSTNWHGNWDDLQCARRSGSGSLVSLVPLNDDGDRRISGPGSSHVRPSFDDGRGGPSQSQQKARMPDKNTWLRPVASSGIRNPINRPEGEAPWLASFYKRQPDLKLSLEEQRLPTYTKRPPKEGEVEIKDVADINDGAFGAGSDSVDFGYLPPLQSPCEKDLTASDHEEHGVTEAVAGPSLVHAAASSFGEARLELELLRLGIDTLEDSSESRSDISGESDTLTDSRHSSQLYIKPEVSGPTNDNEEGSESHHGDPGSSYIDADGSGVTDTSPSAQGYGRKRQRFDTTNKGGARTEVCFGEKRSRLPCKRFFCCFRKGPSRECSGTDETISEVLKKLSEHHDTHVCDRCWVLKLKSDSSGLFVHPPGALDCLDHCLSPQCHETTPTIGHRHKFDQGTCKTKTSRVRPGDGEAVYRFIFSLVHPTLESPVEVVTAEQSLHLGAVPRQGRRKATREELTAQADLLEERLEDLEKKHVDRTGQIDCLKQELLDAHSKIERDREKTASLEAKMRRVVAILGDALRTGEFRDQQGHRSLLMRVGEDAPDALSLLSQPSPSPPNSTSGQHPSFMPTWEKTNAAAQCQLSQDACPMSSSGVASCDIPHGDSFGTQTSQQTTMDTSFDDQNMAVDWLNLLDDPGNVSNVSTYMDSFS
jgi:hypothetical protein